jgi:hypothetical protein
MKKGNGKKKPECGSWFKLVEAKSLKNDTSDAEDLEQGDYFRFLGISSLGLYECYCHKKKAKFWISGNYLVEITDNSLINELEQQVPPEFKKPTKIDTNSEPYEKDEEASKVATEIAHKLISYLNQHLNESRGYMGQSPYQDDIFQLFQEAYENKCYLITCSPRLTADGLTDYLSQNWASGEQEGSKKWKLLKDLTDRWHHWAFAWKKLKGQ